MDELEHYLSLIRKNLDKKSYNEETKQKILETIREKYTDSPIFEPIVDDEEPLTRLNYDSNVINNCFGIENKGFRAIDFTPRMNRVDCLRKCYANSVSPFSPDETVDPLNEKGRYGWTPLHEAVASGDYAQVADLLKKGANPYATDNSGQTPFMLARMASHVAMLAFLELWGIKS